jgi:hypothetical protein
MNAGVLAGCGLGAVVAAMNFATMRRLWASPVFERPQKIAQSVVLWLLPGSFILVRRVLVDHLPRRSLGPDDSNVSNEGLQRYDETVGHGGHGFGGGEGAGGGPSVGGD